MDSNSLQKMQDFFSDDLKVKELITNLMPTELDFYDDLTIFNYQDKLIKI